MANILKNILVTKFKYEDCDVCGKKAELKRVETSGGIIRVCKSCLKKKRK